MAVFYAPPSMSNIYNKKMKSQGPKISYGSGVNGIIRQLSSSEKVFAIPELIVHIFCFVMMDYDSINQISYYPRTLIELSVVSKSFHEASSSNSLWQQICLERWRLWDFTQRWKRAMFVYSNSVEQPDHFWKMRFILEEPDVKAHIAQMYESCHSDDSDYCAVSCFEDENYCDDFVDLSCNFCG